MLWLFKLNIDELNKYLGIKVTYMRYDRRNKRRGDGVYCTVYVFFFLDGRLARPPALAFAFALAGVDARDILSTLSAFCTSSITRFCPPKHQFSSPIRAQSRFNARCHATSSRRSLPVSPPAPLPSRSFPARYYTDVEVPAVNDS